MSIDLSFLNEDQREDFEERAAILEFEAGMTREEAESAAYREAVRRSQNELPE